MELATLLMPWAKLDLREKQCTERCENGIASLYFEKQRKPTYVSSLIEAYSMV